MDVRVKTFVAEASGQLGAMLEVLGFDGPDVDAGRDGYPLVMEVRFHRTDATVSTRLILAYMGEEEVVTELVWTGEAPEHPTDQGGQHHGAHRPSDA